MKSFFFLIFKWRLLSPVKFKISGELGDHVVQPLHFPFQDKNTGQKGLKACPRLDMSCHVTKTTPPDS